MIDILSCTRNWFVDGTFMIVKQPFTQLLNINAFINCDKSLKQIPLAFVIMTGKCKKNYKPVSGGDMNDTNVRYPLALRYVFINRETWE